MERIVMDFAYNIKATVKDRFYGVPTVSGGTPEMDANALASLACGMTRMRASNGHHYWYLFIKDNECRDVVRFLLRRNGFCPEYHKSMYYGAPQPAFRMRMATIVKYRNLDEFVGLVDKAYRKDAHKEASYQRYVDTIKTRLNERKIKTK